MSDRSFNIAFGLSLAFHLTLLSGQFTQGQRPSIVDRVEPLELIYEEQQVQFKLNHLEEQLARLQETGFEVPAAKHPGAKLVVRIPEQFPVLTEANTPDSIAPQTPVVDLTDLIDASQGDPVLLSYFSAIREQIQRTATKNASLLERETREGVIYISFVLSAAGHVEHATVLAERSVDSSTLQQIAVAIVQKASPFLPFPPSIKDARKTIIVPFEFLLGVS